MMSIIFTQRSKQLWNISCEKLENYKYNAVNGNWNTARIIDQELLEPYFTHAKQLSPQIRISIQNVCCLFHIAPRHLVLKQLPKGSKQLKRLKKQPFPWVYIQSNGFAHPLVKNILWNVLNRLENKIQNLAHSTNRDSQ